METFFNNLLEFFFILIGLQLIYTAYKVFTNKSNSKRISSTAFGIWFAII